jgi:hypothetical protein
VGLATKRATSLGVVAERTLAEVHAIVDGSPLTADWDNSGTDRRPDLWATALWLDRCLDDEPAGTDVRVCNVFEDGDRVSHLVFDGDE